MSSINSVIWQMRITLKELYTTVRESVFKSLSQVVCTPLVTWRWLSWLAANGAKSASSANDGNSADRANIEAKMYFLG